jgi:hypothetical protein
VQKFQDLNLDWVQLSQKDEDFRSFFKKWPRNFKVEILQIIYLFLELFKKE